MERTHSSHSISVRPEQASPTRRIREVHRLARPPLPDGATAVRRPYAASRQDPAQPGSASNALRLRGRPDFVEVAGGAPVGRVVSNLSAHAAVPADK